jgi:hypothetical protein
LGAETREQQALARRSVHLAEEVRAAGRAVSGNLADVDWGCARDYHRRMIVIRFPDSTIERQALGFLAGRFSFKSWHNGDTLVPDAALPVLALEGIRFSVEGPARYEHLVPPLRNPAAGAV